MNAARLDLRFDADRLRSALDAIPADAWVAHFNTDYYEGDWSAVALRSPDGSAAQIVPAPGSEGSAVDTPHCRGALAEVLARFACPVPSARLMRLGPGARIHEHRDPDIGLDAGLVRLHVPIRTHAEVDFRLEGERVVMAPGECWYLDLGRAHAVTNGGEADRVHLVLDCVLDSWLEALLASAGVELPDPDRAHDVRPEDLPLVIAELRRLGTPAALEQARRLEDLE